MSFFSLNYTSFWDRVVEWYSGSWIDRFFNFLYEQVFYVPFGQYNHIPLPADAGKTAGGYIFTFLIAFWLVAITAVYVKSVPGGFVRKLLKMDATSPDRAVTLAEAGYAKRRSIRRELSRGGAFAKLLCRTQDGTHTVAGTPVPVEEQTEVTETGEVVPSLWDRLNAPERSTPKKDAPSPQEELSTPDPQPESFGNLSAPLDFVNDRFYIPASLRIRAELRYKRKGNDWIAAVFSVVLSTVVAVVLAKFLPLLFRFANFVLGG